MQRRLAGLTVLTVCLLLVPVPATAGGWWSSIQVDKDPVAIGETATATATVLFASIEQAQEVVQEGGYHAYLVQGVDRERLDEAMTTGEPGTWWTVPPTALHLAELEFSGTDANLTEARATFTVPDVEPGLYGLMFCSEGCTEPMADVVPTLDIPVHDDPLLAHMVQPGDRGRGIAAVRDREPPGRGVRECGRPAQAGPHRPGGASAVADAGPHARGEPRRRSHRAVPVDASTGLARRGRGVPGGRHAGRDRPLAPAAPAPAARSARATGPGRRARVTR